MGVRFLRRWLALIVLVSVSGGVEPLAAWAQGAKDANALNTPEERIALEAHLAAVAALNLDAIDRTYETKKKCEMHREEQSRQQALKQSVQQQHPKCVHALQFAGQYMAEHKTMMDKACAP